MPKIGLPLALTLIVLHLAAPFAGIARADDDGGEDYDHILKSVREGRIKPLSTIKALVLKKWPGEIVGLSIDREKSKIVYEIRILAANGRLIEVEVDAASGKVLEVENE